MDTNDLSCKYYWDVLFIVVLTFLGREEHSRAVVHTRSMTRPWIHHHHHPHSCLLCCSCCVLHQPPSSLQNPSPLASVVSFDTWIHSDFANHEKTTVSNYLHETMHTLAILFSLFSFFPGVFCGTGLDGVAGGSSFFTDAGAATAGEAVTCLFTGAFSFFTLMEFGTGAFWGVEGGSCFTGGVPLVEGTGFTVGLDLLRASCFLGGYIRQ